MPEKQTLRRVRKDKRAGKAASTQAGEFAREEIHHVREGKHGVRSTKQAIAIGLSKARRAGVKLPPPSTGSFRTKRRADQAQRAGRRKRPVSARRSRATTRVLGREKHRAASRQALAHQAHEASQRRSSSARRASARQSARTKGAKGRKAAARRAARTRESRRMRSR
jgi:hypothetical protein